MSKYTELMSEVAKRGFKISGGINWTWIENIPTKEEAEEMLAIVERLGLDNRGIYSPLSIVDPFFAIRYR